MTDSGELECFEEAMQVETRKKWEQGMDEEMDSLVRNQAWDLVKFHVEKRALKNKWVYMLKEEYGGKKQYKERLVVKGFAQKKGIDFDEIFSHVVIMTSTRTILSLVVVEYLHLMIVRFKNNLSPWVLGGRYLYAVDIWVQGQREGEFSM